MIASKTPPSSWQREDVVRLTLDRGTAIAVASDFPEYYPPEYYPNVAEGRGFRDVWTIAVHDDDWDEVGTSVTTEWVEAHNPVLLYRSSWPQVDEVVRERDEVEEPAEQIVDELVDWIQDLQQQKEELLDRIIKLEERVERTEAFTRPIGGGGGAGWVWHIGGGGCIPLAIGGTTSPTSLL